ncbi:NACHT domain-containing protein [Actinoplanes missouriensis]|nr:NACHT domain-containing protein [Actinoplanes missouriensis]
MEFVLDRIGPNSFKVLVADLTRELTKLSLKVIDTGTLHFPADTPPTTVRWPSFLQGGVWTGHTVIDCLYVPKESRSSWTAAEFRAALAQRLDKEFQTRERARAVQDGDGFPPNPFDYRPPDYRPPDYSSGAAPPLPPEPSPVFTDYLVIATNLPASVISPPDCSRLLAEHAEALGLKGWKIWDLTTLTTMLAQAEPVRRKYLSEIAPDDVFSRLHEYDLGVTKPVLDLFMTQATNELDGEKYVRLSQAGDATAGKIPLSQVGVDLPVKGEAKMAARLIIEAADTASPFHRSGPVPNVLLLGGPGQGKSTIAQLIGQCYRTALLDGSLSPQRTSHALLVSLQKGLQEARIPRPRLRRWPVRVNLAEYVDWAARHHQSLITYIAEAATPFVEGMTGRKLRSWLKAWPWLLILDGFDEVASAHDRDTLMQQLRNFMNESESLGGDVFVLATTRPQGYAGEFSQHGYQSVELASLERQQAVDYGLKLAQARHSDDPEMRKKVSERINVAANDKFTARLMRSPLQVTIMSILLEARERVPRARYALFNGYYETIYARETTKKDSFRELLENRDRDIHELHNWLGLMLQVKSEQAGDLDASIPADDLRLKVVQRLRDEGYDQAKATKLAQQIIEALIERLVLIVPKRDREYGFEVRSIQEFFAARAIVSGSDTAVLHRMGQIIEPAHWRNTWLFAAGKAFSEREHIRRDIVTLLTDIDSRDLVRMLVSPGADLAFDLLDDEVANNVPVLQRLLFDRALELLKYPPDHDLRRRAPVLFQQAALADADYLAVKLDQAIAQAAGGTPAQVEAAHAVLRLAGQRATPLALKLRQRLRALERETDPSRLTGEAVTRRITDAWDRSLRDSHLSVPDDATAKAFLTQAMTSSTEEPLHWDYLDSCLSRPAVAAALARATLATAEIDAAMASKLRDLIRLWVQRKASGAGLLDDTDA